MLQQVTFKEIVIDGKTKSPRVHLQGRVRQYTADIRQRRPSKVNSSRDKHGR